MIRNCEGCGKLFKAKTKRNTRCRKDCGRSSESANRARTKARELTEFIGVDGEGVTYCANCNEIKRDESNSCVCGSSDWIHDYVLLSVGSESLYNEDASHLHWRQIFPFLYEQFEKNPNAAFVGFFLGYDFTQWLRTLNESRARSLLSKEGIAKRNRKKSGGNPMPFPVHVGEWEWEIDMLGMKRFRIRPGTGLPPGGIKNTKPWMVICDSGSFFQMRFTSAIKPEIGKLITQEEYDTVLEGKSRRSTAKFDAAMVRYNLLENDILGRVMAQLNDGFKAAGLKLRKDQWFGPGQAAQAWLDKIGAPTGELIREVVPEYAREAARKTYFGGWFEIFRHGVVPGLAYEYDINSAYPYVISRLPCLLHGKWSSCVVEGKRELRELDSLGERSIRILHGVATGDDLWVGALLHRTKEGRVMRPNKTAGWYWQHEVEAGMAAGIIDTFEVDEYVQYDGCDCPPPFRAIADLYQLRIDVGKNSSHGKAYKLIYNSAYGKMAQSIGNPKYSNPIYASLITTGCRTMITHAIATHPKKTKDLLMVATDGVYFRSPHPSLEIDKSRLGAWDESTKQNLTLFMPGIYWDDASRQAIKEGKDPKLKSRGISASDLGSCIAEIDKQFKKHKMGDEWPAIELPIKFNMVTAVLALARGKWETAGKVSFDGVKKLNSNPHTKRNPSSWVDPENDYIIASLPYSVGPELESTPYDRRFGDEMEELNMTIEVNPDGEFTHDFTEMLGIKEV